MESLNNIVAWFAENGMPLEHFPEEGDFREMYQFDGVTWTEGGYLSLLVQFYVGINGLGKHGVFGDITFCDGSSIDITCSEDSWLEDMVPWIKEFIK